LHNKFCILSPLLIFGHGAFIKVFFWGMLISFLGTLPMGTLNITAMQISIQESAKSALLFVLGSLTVEMIYVRISLVGIQWLQRQERLMKIMQWLTFGIILAWLPVV
jgi:threonine/homoserine/homoserine lactone efflux protein